MSDLAERLYRELVSEVISADADGYCEEVLTADQIERRTKEHERWARHWKNRKAKR